MIAKDAALNAQGEEVSFHVHGTAERKMDAADLEQ